MNKRFYSKVVGLSEENYAYLIKERKSLTIAGFLNIIINEYKYGINKEHKNKST